MTGRPRTFLWHLVLGKPWPAVVFEDHPRVGCEGMAIIDDTEVKIQADDPRTLDELALDYPAPRIADSINWDAMIAGDDDEVSAEIRVDSIVYGKLLTAGDDRGCREIEQRYGLYGLPPQQVSEQLAEMCKPSEGGIA